MSAAAGQAAALRLELEPAGAGFTLTATVGPDETEIATIEIPRGGIEARSSLNKELRSFREKAPGLDEDAPASAAGDALDALWEKTWEFATQMFGGPTGLGEFAEKCASVLPPALRTPDDPPLIDIVAPADAFLPVELFPLFDQHWPDAIESWDQLQTAALSFVGFSAVTRRVPPNGLQAGSGLKSKPLPIAFVPYEGMPAASVEADRLACLADVALDEPLPHRQLAKDEAARILSARIWNGEGTYGLWGTLNDEILHFACHCDSDSRSGGDWSLTVGTKLGSRVKMGELGVQLARRRREGKAIHRATPLVFMNACGTSSINSSSAASFVSLFLDNRSRVFIGTETRVPDEFAAAFSQVFYRRLLNSMTVAGAIHGAKWDMLERYKNPLGILYTLYGDPDLRVDETDQVVPSEPGAHAT
jgi:hypothetical protein